MMAPELSPQQLVYAEANRLAKLGISVIPIAAGTKEPPVGFKWGRYATEIADASERYTWFIDQGHQLAVVPGTISGNLIPLDYDSPTGFESHAAQYPALRTYPRIRTGSGKTHVWVRSKTPTRKYVCTTPDGGKLEVRAGTHYTLCPPSLHPSGDHYRWEVEPWGGVPIIDLESIGLKVVTASEEQQREPISEGAPLTDAEKTHVLQLLAPHYVPYARHEVCLALAGWLAGHGVPELDAQTLVRTLALNHGDEDRVREYLRGVRDTYRKAREGIAVAGWARLNDRDDALISKTTAAQLDLLLRYRNPIFSFEPERKSGLPWLISVNDLLAEPDEPDVWLAEGIWRAATLGMIVGPPKTYKSFFAQELAVALATATPVFGVYSVPEPVTVIYVQEESARRYLRRRFGAILTGRQMHPGTLDNRLLTITNERFRLDDPSHLERLISEGVTPYGPKLILFDPLREMHWQDENKAESMMPILQALKNIRDTYNVGIGVIHHNNKNPLYTNPGESVRGSTAIWGAMDAGIFVSTTEVEGRVKVNIVQKEGGQVAPFFYELHDQDGGIAFDVIGLNETPKTVDDATIIRAVGRLGWATIAEVAESIGLSERRLRPRLIAIAGRGDVQSRASSGGKTGRPRVLYGPKGASQDDPDF